jgi:SiaC family regulatory phosphoprotein
MIMTQLTIEETRNSPEVSFEGQTFIIKGISTMVNAMEFYAPLLAYFDECAHDLPKEIHVEINLSYYNSSSNKCLYLLMERIKRLIDQGVSAKIIWCVEEEDEFMREGGQTIEELLGLHFHYRQVPFNLNRLF